MLNKIASWFRCGLVRLFIHLLGTKNTVVNKRSLYTVKFFMRPDVERELRDRDKWLLEGDVKLSFVFVVFVSNNIGA